MAYLASSMRWLSMGASASLIGVILLGVVWELMIAPLRPGGSMMVLKVLPLLLALRGVLKRDLYTLQWSTMLILLYLAEGVVRGLSDPQPLSMLCAWVETVLTGIFFLCAIFFIRPYKKAVKAKNSVMTMKSLNDEKDTNAI